MGMDMNPGFCFTSQGLDSSVRREKERSEQNPFSPTITNGSSGVKKDVTIHFTSYKIFLKAIKLCLPIWLRTA
jgi:hypothetical protein